MHITSSQVFRMNGTEKSFAYNETSQALGECRKLKTIGLILTLEDGTKIQLDFRERRHGPWTDVTGNALKDSE